MFAINQDGHVVWAASGLRVTHNETLQMSGQEGHEYGRLCVKALEKGYEPERIR